MATTALVPRAKPSYYPYPYSIDPLTDELKRGLIPVGIFALISVMATLALLLWITYRLVSWRRHYRAYVGYNQYVLLIYNLLLADLQQSLSFMISFHWLSEDRMVAPTSACFGQAWLVQIGDISSGMFVLAIALHTFFSVVKGRQLPFNVFLISIVSIWVFSLFMTMIGPAMHGQKFFTKAGAWCWISEDYENERLWFHYFWIFIIEFGTIIIYALIFLYLRKQLASILSASQSRTPDMVTKATRYMIAYPLTYVILTLPLAAGRMAAMTGKTLPTVYYCIAGTMMTSCGWVDAALYALTRKILVSDEIDHRGNSGRNAHNSGWEITSFDKGAGGITAADHTVTITGGRGTRGSVSGRKDPAFISTAERGRAAARKHGNHHRRGSSPISREPSPHGSTDSMIKNDLEGIIGVRAETKVEVTVERAGDFLSEASSEVSGKTHDGKRASSPDWSH
ncbi:uncharacterized protein K452DRAFT_220171 [Aplosporella prunicola CBS 121167]|uniref:G protein-coupled receptor GPR1/2/3 C-terminal domain-containing protein n=1 Tax=Aplosporella prunicola CBS 121167 TaxID=1176127 RepID=A0A6A6BSN4_9PEZI|nr:uncharacterized protein K452DRAFT_220171 [Aplosporella prunicola CBS 121167]KAF2146254.1 hypothetical protein K452DRAFT_220171 [Aplosporella prunicola CBS 121167]